MNRPTQGRAAFAAGIVAAGLAISALAAGCRDVPPPGGGAAGESHEEQLAQADVIFEGTILSVGLLSREVRSGGVTIHAPPGTVVAAVDPRWLAVVHVDSVRQGAGPRWSGDVPLAIHSPVRDLGLSAEAAPGRKRVFYLFGVREEEDGRTRCTSLLAEHP